jgi:pSer/pThr/pTyr-binding forkhead associated (FHA) protein
MPTKTRLRITRDNQLIRLAELPAEQEWILGAHPSCDLFINSTLVSLRHVSLRLKSDGLLLRDLNSRHGVYKNGYRVQHAVLKHGDCVRLADIQLRFEDFRVPFHPDQCPRVVVEIAPVYVGDHPRRISLQPGLTFLGGDSALAEISFRDDFVSGCHAELMLDPYGICLTDLGSTNGTLLGSREIRDAWLEDNAQVRLSPRSRFQVEIQPARDPITSQSLLSTRVWVALLVSFFLLAGSYTWLVFNPPPAEPVDESLQNYEKAVALARQGVFRVESSKEEPDKKKGAGENIGAEQLLDAIITAGPGAKAYSDALSFRKEIFPRWERNWNKARKIGSLDNPSPEEVFRELLADTDLEELRFLLDDRAAFPQFQRYLSEALGAVQLRCLDNARAELDRFDQLLRNNTPESRRLWVTSISDILDNPLPCRLWPNSNYREDASQLMQKADNRHKLLVIHEEYEQSRSGILLTLPDSEERIEKLEELLKRFKITAGGDSLKSISDEIGGWDADIKSLREKLMHWKEVNDLYITKKYSGFLELCKEDKKQFLLTTPLLPPSKLLDMIRDAERIEAEKAETKQSLENWRAFVDGAESIVYELETFEEFREISQRHAALFEEVNKLKEKHGSDAIILEESEKFESKEFKAKYEELADFYKAILELVEAFRTAESAGNIADTADAGFHLCLLYNKLAGAFKTAPWTFPYVKASLEKYRGLRAQLKEQNTPASEACLFCIEGRLSRIVSSCWNSPEPMGMSRESWETLYSEINRGRKEFLDKRNTYRRELNEYNDLWSRGVVLTNEELEKMTIKIIALAYTLPTMTSDDTYYEEMKKEQDFLREIWKRVESILENAGYPNPKVPPCVDCGQFFKTLQVPSISLSQ